MFVIFLLSRKILSKRNEIRPTKQLLLQNHIIKYEHYYPAQC